LIVMLLMLLVIIRLIASSDDPGETRDIGAPSGNLKESGIELNWVAFDEKSSDESYVIEKMDNSGEYVEVAKVMTRGTLEGLQDYLFMDHDISNELNDYRISIVDGITGDVIEIGKVTVMNTITDYEVKLYPNITTDIATLEVQVSDETQLDVSLMDINGQLILKNFISEGLRGGVYQYKLETGTLNPGTYLLNIRLNENVITEKLIKVSN